MSGAEDRRRIEPTPPLTANVFVDDALATFENSTNRAVRYRLSEASLLDTESQRFAEMLRFVECSKIAALYFTRLEKIERIVGRCVDT